MTNRDSTLIMKSMQELEADRVRHRDAMIAAAEEIDRRTYNRQALVGRTYRVSDGHLTVFEVLEISNSNYATVAIFKLESCGDIEIKTDTEEIYFADGKCGLHKSLTPITRDEFDKAVGTILGRAATLAKGGEG